MRSYGLICAVLVLALFANAVERKDAPAPALRIPGEDSDISLSGIVQVRPDQTKSGLQIQLGTGMSATVSHYFTRHFGISADADFMRSDYVQFQGYGYRAGPTVRLNHVWRVEPFARALFGYSRYKETNTGPKLPYVSGLSFLAGGGGDLRLSGSIFARLAADYEQQTDSPRPHYATARMLRDTMGLSYRSAELPTSVVGPLRTASEIRTASRNVQ